MIVIPKNIVKMLAYLSIWSSYSNCMNLSLLKIRYYFLSYETQKVDIIVDSSININACNELLITSKTVGEFITKIQKETIAVQQKLNWKLFSTNIEKSFNFYTRPRLPCRRILSVKPVKLSQSFCLLIVASITTSIRTPPMTIRDSSCSSFNLKLVFANSIY